jgi:hypothetical protein
MGSEILKTMEKVTNENLVGGILLPARTQSEWDNCDAYLIKPDPEMFRDLLSRIDDADYINAIGRHEGGHNVGFAHIAYYDSCGVFVCVNNPSDWKHENEDSPVVVDEDFPMDLEIVYPEQDIDSLMVKATSESVYFTGYGKYTDEKFWTSKLTREFIEKTLKQLEP